MDIIYIYIYIEIQINIAVIECNTCSIHQSLGIVTNLAAAKCREHHIVGMLLELENLDHRFLLETHLPTPN